MEMLEERLFQDAEAMKSFHQCHCYIFTLDKSAGSQLHCYG